MSELGGVEATELALSAFEDSRFRVVVREHGCNRGYRTYSYGSEASAKECATVYRNAGYHVACYFPRLGAR